MRFSRHPWPPACLFSTDYDLLGQRLATIRRCLLDYNGLSDPVGDYFRLFAARYQGKKIWRVKIKPVGFRGGDACGAALFSTMGHDHRGFCGSCCGGAICREQRKKRAPGRLGCVCGKYAEYRTKAGFFRRHAFFVHKGDVLKSPSHGHKGPGLLVPGRGMVIIDIYEKRGSIRRIA